MGSSSAKRETENAHFTLSFYRRLLWQREGINETWKPEMHDFLYSWDSQSKHSNINGQWRRTIIRKDCWSSQFICITEDKATPLSHYTWSAVFTLRMLTKHQLEAQLEKQLKFWLQIRCWLERQAKIAEIKKLAIRENFRDSTKNTKFVFIIARLFQ